MIEFKTAEGEALVVLWHGFSATGGWQRAAADYLRAASYWRQARQFSPLAFLVRSLAMLVGATKLGSIWTGSQGCAWTPPMALPCRVRLAALFVASGNDMIDFWTAKIEGHRRNIQRYIRLLATELTEFERQYLHNQIAEEQAELMRLELEAER